MPSDAHLIHLGGEALAVVQRQASCRGTTIAAIVAEAIAIHRAVLDAHDLGQKVVLRSLDGSWQELVLPKVRENTNAE